MQWYFIVDTLRWIPSVLAEFNEISRNFPFFLRSEKMYALIHVSYITFTFQETIINITLYYERSLHVTLYSTIEIIVSNLISRCKIRNKVISHLSSHIIYTNV